LKSVDNFEQQTAQRNFKAIEVMSPTLFVAALCVGITYAQEQPSVVSNDGNLEFRLPREKQAIITQESTIDLVAFAAKVDDVIDTKVPALKAGLTQDPTIGAYTAAMDQRVSTFAGLMDSKSRVDQIDQMVKDAKAKMAALSSRADKATTSFDDTSKNLTAFVKKTFSALQGRANGKILAAEKKLNATLKKVEDAIVKAVTDDYYIHWGSKNCRKLSSSKKLKTSTKSYEGWMHGSQHNHRGGGMENLCLIDESGTQGGRSTSGYHDGVRPIRLEHTGETSIRNVESRIIPCAKCAYPSKCYDEIGVEGCKIKGYSPMYVGWMFGGYHNHHGNNERQCIDMNINVGEWNNRDYYVSHIYPTKTIDATGSRSGGTKTVYCSKCCKDLVE